MIQLFQVKSVADNLHGYKDVHIEWLVSKRAVPLFGPAGALGIPYRDVIEEFDDQDPMMVNYAKCGIEEYFTAEEAQALVAWLRAHRDDPGTMMVPAKLPWPRNTIGVGAIPAGGGPDFLVLCAAPDYNLPFKVMGYHDVRGCVFNETLPGACRSRRGFILRYGTIEPWYLSDDE